MGALLVRVCVREESRVCVCVCVGRALRVWQCVCTVHVILENVVHLYFVSTIVKLKPHPLNDSSECDTEDEIER